MRFHANKTQDQGVLVIPVFVKTLARDASAIIAVEQLSRGRRWLLDETSSFEEITSDRDEIMAVRDSIRQYVVHERFSRLQFFGPAPANDQTDIAKAEDQALLLKLRESAG